MRSRDDRQSRLEGLAAELAAKASGLEAGQILQLVLDRFGEGVALATSLGAEDQVLIDLAVRLGLRPRVFTIDTGRLPQQTYELIEQTQRVYGITIRVLFPSTQALEQMINSHGPNLFYRSAELRRLCCQVRKLEPLKRALAGLDAWICGLRSEQSVTRSGIKAVEWDRANGLIKVCPLADWTTEQVWRYIHQYQVPYNSLHDRGYPSIGCAPCTRAVGPGEDLRAGRWWWEGPTQRECGLHARKRQ